MVTELLPCHFCGGEARLSDETYGVTFMSWVYCPNCDAQGAPRHIEQEAIEAWNTRHEETCKFVSSKGSDNPPVCSACGYELGIYDCSWYEDGTYEYSGNYCPNCGRKVER